MTIESHPLDSYAAGAVTRVGVKAECSIILREHRALRYVASSSDRAARCDQVEVETNEGPCVLALQQVRSVLVTDLHADTRWPVWRDTALGLGFRSAAALPGVVDNETTIALNLYSELLDPWDTDALLAMDAYVQEITEAIRTGLIDGRLHW